MATAGNDHLSARDESQDEMLLALLLKLVEVTWTYLEH
jgi:hypothetical protein